MIPEQKVRKLRPATGDSTRSEAVRKREAARRAARARKRSVFEGANDPRWS